MKFILSNSDLDTSIARDYDKIEKISIGNFSLLCNDSSTIDEDEDTTIITDGYVRDTNFESKLEQHLWAAKGISDNWPVKPNITGTFSSCIVQKNKNEIILATDHINIYPLYYLIENDRIFISNSIILIGRYSKAKFDDTGIFQRAVGPNFMNIGSRTILQHCKRILPGERRKYNSDKKLISREFDNSLYQDISPSNFQNGQIESYWSAYKKEVELCTNEHSEVSIALSGGIDSRIALGAIPKKLKTVAYTFGDPKNYESKIATKLSSATNIDHKICSDFKQYFPSRNVLKRYSRETESVRLNSWLEILENIEKNKKIPILLGELCEGLPARNIKKFNTTNFRRDNFVRFYLKSERISLTAATGGNFEKWKAEQMRLILSWHSDYWFNILGFEQQKKEIFNNTRKDAEEIFKRIEDHRIPYSELFTELFSWYTFTRMELAKQVNICNEKFYAYSPGMSMQILKRTSNIHPNLRLYYRFANKLLRSSDFERIGNIPTSQIPIAPQTWPNLLKIPIWGIRSKIDDFLIRRMMKFKDVNRRYRILTSTHWPKVYHQENMIENIAAYYHPNYLGEDYYKTFSDLATNRRDLTKWPFANMDIISGAALNMEIGLIRKLPN